jgi:hypothetical protein
MPTALRISASNYCSTATVSVVSTQQAAYPATNALEPQRPFLPWRTTASSSDQYLHLDFGAQKLVELVALVGVNYQSARLVLDTDAAFAVPLTYSSGVVPVNYNLWSSGYRRAFLISPGVTVQYLQLMIPANAALGYFDTGGIWAGPLIGMSRDIRWDEIMERIEPHVDVEPAHRGWRQRMQMGYPKTIIHAKALAVVGAGENSSSYVELNEWRSFHHYTTGGAPVAWYSNRAGTGDDVWIMRRINDPAIPLNQRAAEFDVELEELTGP